MKLPTEPEEIFMMPWSDLRKWWIQAAAGTLIPSG